MPSKKYYFVMTIWIGLVMSVILAAGLTVAQGVHLTLEGFLFTFAVSFASAVVFPNVLPFGKWSAAFARRFNTTPGSTADMILSNMFFAVLMLVAVGLVVTIALTGVGSLGGMSLLDRWIGLVIQFFPMIFVVILLILPPCLGLTDASVRQEKRFAK